ncbi:phage holin [Listeria monocytogenes]|nr:phage holin [Listeria monocytogenes]EDN9859081.1 phage holin [Listeria monocytogenes]EEO3726949.1 phage holin [Listeria monocytogenes]EEO3758311.1 phage holin [Listeria monocytogenes]EEO6755774.1 phage holin [Listeria monocytogenes]
MKINWKLRLKNPQMWVPFLLFLGSTILATAQVEGANLNSWAALGDLLLSVISNPYQLFAVLFAVYGYLVDPTTKGVSDSAKALNYSEPRKDEDK